MTLRQSATVHVCALRHVPEMVKHTGAQHLVSVIDAHFLPDTPTAISRDRHLKLGMHDIFVRFSIGSMRPSWASFRVSE